jgi:hypothetical protein
MSWRCWTQSEHGRLHGPTLVWKMTGVGTVYRPTLPPQSKHTNKRCPLAASPTPRPGRTIILSTPEPNTRSRLKGNCRPDFAPVDALQCATISPVCRSGVITPNTATDARTVVPQLDLFGVRSRIAPANVCGPNIFGGAVQKRYTHSGITELIRIISANIPRHRAMRVPCVGISDRREASVYHGISTREPNETFN